MFKNKRGAVELSITTIVIVVIGITLLALGLAWVSNIFERLEGTTKGAFEKADAEISNIFAGGSQDKPFRLSPNEISLKQGGRGRATIVLSNQEAGGPDITVRAERIGGGIEANEYSGGSTYKDRVICLLADTVGVSGKDGRESQDYTLKSSKEVKIPVVIDVKGNAPLGDYTCNFKSTASGTNSAAWTILDILPINVKVTK